MQQETRPRFDPEDLLRRVPQDRAEFFVGYNPSAADFEGWRRSVREEIPEAFARPVRRTVWDDPEHPGGRVLVDVTEAPSAAEAIAALVDRLSWNQLAELEEGPAELGDVAYVHPAGVPPAAYFVRGNLCVSIISFGSEPVETLPVAMRLHKRLAEHPTAEQMNIHLEVEAERAKVGEAVDLSHRLPRSLGDEGYLKIVVRGGTIESREGRLLIKGTRPGDLSVEAFTVEPGRETYGGRLTLPID